MQLKVSEGRLSKFTKSMHSNETANFHIYILHVCPFQGYKALEFSLMTNLKIKLLMNIIQELIRSSYFKNKQKIRGPFKVFFANYIQLKTFLPPV